MNVWGDPTHHLKRQLDHCTHFRTTMQQNHTAWNTIAYLWHQNVTFIEPDMWPPNSPDLNPVNYTIWVVLHFLLYAVYICQKSLNFTYAFKSYQQNCSWLHFMWTTLYNQSQSLIPFHHHGCRLPRAPKLLRIDTMCRPTGCLSARGEWMLTL